MSTNAETPAETLREGLCEHQRSALAASAIGTPGSPRRPSVRQPCRAVLSHFVDVISSRRVISQRCSVIGSLRGRIVGVKIREHRNVLSLYRESLSPCRDDLSSARTDLFAHRDVLSSPPAGPWAHLMSCGARDRHGLVLPVTSGPRPGSSGAIPFHLAWTRHAAEIEPGPRLPPRRPFHAWRPRRSGRASASHPTCHPEGTRRARSKCKPHHFCCHPERQNFTTWGHNFSAALQDDSSNNVFSQGISDDAPALGDPAVLPVVGGRVKS